MPIGRPCRAGSVVAARDGGVGLLGGGAGAGEIARGDGVHRVVDRLDAGDAAFQQFGGGEALLPDQAAGFDGGQVAGFGHACFRFGVAAERIGGGERLANDRAAPSKEQSWESG